MGSMEVDVEAEEGSSEEKPRTLFVGNIPKQVTKRDLETVFGDFGPLKRCFMQYPRDDGRFRADDTTVAYVTYALAEDAIQALENLSNYKFGTNKISLKFAKSRTEQYREPRYDSGFKPFVEPVAEKPPRPKRIKKKSRLIIRNLAFQASEDKLREYFASFGEITDINILRKPNGKLVGCAFVQYATVPQASKALKELNSKPFLGRPIAIDWALPKEKFQEEGTEDKEIEAVKTEEDADLDPDIKVKTESPDEFMSNYDYVEQAQHIKSEVGDEENFKTEKKKKRKRAKDVDSFSDSESDDSATGDTKRQKRNFNDADDGKTLFIRNVEFETTVEDLKKFFETYGPLNYGVICKDKLTEHPKGTAFVMFRNSADASKCLEAYQSEPSAFILGRRQFVVSVALSKTKLETKLKDGITKEPKDKRNLYLAREGFIRPGTNSAIGVSPMDTNKRTAIQRVKKQMLKNLNTFVSDIRLCIHNLPPSLTDRELRKIFSSNGGPGAKVTEARVMRNLQDTDLDGVGTSKEYGFVSFTTHEHSLKALRAVNNNPKIFTAARRPIVEFSLENRAAIKAKEKREEKSREKNMKKQKLNEEVEVSSKKKQKSDEASEDTDNTNMPKKRNKNQKSKNKKPSGKLCETQNESDQLPSYSGLTAKVGISSLPSLKPKGKITRKSLKPAKLKTRKTKLQPRRMREPKMKPKIKSKDDKVDKLVSQHQRKARRNEKAILKQKKAKWYE